MRVWNQPAIQWLMGAAMIATCGVGCGAAAAAPAVSTPVAAASTPTSTPPPTATPTPEPTPANILDAHGLITPHDPTIKGTCAACNGPGKKGFADYKVWLDAAYYRLDYTLADCAYTFKITPLNLYGGPSDLTIHPPLSGDSVEIDNGNALTVVGPEQQSASMDLGDGFTAVHGYYNINVETLAGAPGCRWSLHLDWRGTAR